MAALQNPSRCVAGVVGVVTRYDGLHTPSETPPLTAINLHLEAVSTAASTCLLDQSEGRPSPRIVTSRVTEIILRASSV
ncbi:MAG: hypothetical protein ACKVKF_18325 [Rhodobacterales bacterium]|nr:hypothetical protein [Puniceibacterium antarcticum]